MAAPPVEYEYAIKAIEQEVDDNIDKKILKYVMIGYEVKDVCEEIGISRKEFKLRLGNLRENKSLETILLSGII